MQQEVNPPSVVDPTCAADSKLHIQASSPSPPPTFRAPVQTLDVLAMLAELGEEGAEAVLLGSGDGNGGGDTPMTPAAVASVRLSAATPVARLLSPMSSPTVSVSVSALEPSPHLHLWQFRALEAQRDNEQLRDEVLGMQARHVEEREVMAAQFEALQHEKDELEMQLAVMRNEWTQHMETCQPEVVDSSCQTDPPSVSCADTQTDDRPTSCAEVQTDDRPMACADTQTDELAVSCADTQTDELAVSCADTQTDELAVSCADTQTDLPPSTDSVGLQTDPDVVPDLCDMEVQTAPEVSDMDVQTIGLDTTDMTVQTEEQPVSNSTTQTATVELDVVVLPCETIAPVVAPTVMAAPPEPPSAPVPSPTNSEASLHHSDDDDDDSDSEFEDQTDDEDVVVGVEETKAGSDDDDDEEDEQHDDDDDEHEHDGETLEVADQAIQTTPAPGSADEAIYDLQQMLISTKVALAEALTDGQTSHMRIKEYEQMLLEAKLQLATTREQSEDRFAELEVLRQQRREWIQSPAANTKPRKSMRARAASVFGIRTPTAGASPKTGR